MSNGSIYKSAQGEAALLRFYDEQVACLPFPVEHRLIETHFGAAHVLVAGDEAKPPLVALHGALAAGAFNLSFFAPLLPHFRIYSPDTPGQPGHSAQVQLSPQHHEYACWLVEVLRGLGLERAAFAGISFGAAILLDLAAYAPAYIAQAALLVPAGLVNSEPLKIMTAFLPWALYPLAPSPAHMRRLFAPFGDEPDDALMQQFDLGLRHLHVMHSQPPGPFSAADLRAFTAPTLVILADGDVFIPVKAAAAKAVEAIPNLYAVNILHSKHSPTRAVMLEMNAILLDFFASSRISDAQPTAATV